MESLALGLTNFKYLRLRGFVTKWGLRMKWENSLMAYEEDVKRRSWTDWLKAHTSGFKPLHRYEGVLELSDEELIFEGRDIREKVEFRLEIPLRKIREVHYGFDEVFRGREERAWPWNKPLRIKYQSEDGEKTIYLFARFHRKGGIIRASDNKEVYEKLRKLISEKESDNY